MSAVRDEAATTACPVCGTAFVPIGRQKFCSTGCRQAGWRVGRRAPVEPMVARSSTVYECPTCEARYFGEQRCEECNTWCRRVGPGALCPHCDGPVAITDLFSAEQLANVPSGRKQRRSTTG
ncbi:MAG: hypothetical protein ACYDDZ_14715 [Acidimicrobiales bacterium]